MILTISGTLSGDTVGVAECLRVPVLVFKCVSCRVILMTRYIEVLSEYSITVVVRTQQQHSHP